MSSFLQPARLTYCPLRRDWFIISLRLVPRQHSTVDKRTGQTAVEFRNWPVSLLGEPARKLWNQPGEVAVSRDGSQIAFVTADSRRDMADAGEWSGASSYPDGKARRKRYRPTVGACRQSASPLRACIPLRRTRSGKGG